MRRILASLAFLLASLTPVFAQGFLPAGSPPWVFADNYGRWSFQNQAANVFSFTPLNSINGCQVTQLNFANKPTFYAFSDAIALAPIYIADVNSANSEVVTPGSYFTPTSTTCGVNLSPANSHTTFTLQSGTGGLQEALNAMKGGGTILLSSQWYGLISGIANANATLTNQITPAGVITSAACGAGETVIDVTSNPWSVYGCNASGALILQTPAPKPSIAAGAGAGSGPTIAILAGSNNSSGTFTLTTGTSPTASATVATITFSAPDYGGGFPYAPTCTVTSVSATEPYTSGTVTTTAGSGTSGGTLVFTASATALTASVSGFKFTYSCH
jgi:hypothetical protein